MTTQTRTQPSAEQTRQIIAELSPQERKAFAQAQQANAQQQEAKSGIKFPVMFLIF
ncbi:MAG: hypothetical protein GKR89_06745 [Candidatus Latescibacteria bacterium]|nr:hypothetical protein [Candidatus Latescibacterota bacterium]